MTKFRFKYVSFNCIHFLSAFLNITRLFINQTINKIITFENNHQLQPIMIILNHLLSWVMGKLYRETKYHEGAVSSDPVVEVKYWGPVWSQLRGTGAGLQCAALTALLFVQESQSTVVHNPPDGVKVRRVCCVSLKASGLTSLLHSQACRTRSRLCFIFSIFLFICLHSTGINREQRHQRWRGNER